MVLSAMIADVRQAEGVGREKRTTATGLLRQPRFLTWKENEKGKEKQRRETTETGWGSGFFSCQLAGTL